MYYSFGIHDQIRLYVLMGAVEALHEIAEQVGKKDWNFTLNPCGGNSNRSIPYRKEMPLQNNTLSCNCSYPNGQCHVVQMYDSFPGYIYVYIFEV